MSARIDRNIAKLRRMGCTDEDIMDMVKDELRELAHKPKASKRTKRKETAK